MMINLHGINFSYQDRGRGSPILFIHGFPLNRHMWQAQVEYLSTYFRTISVDLRGHGDTQAIPGPYSMEMLAGDCNALLESLQVDEPVVLCGLSMGGYISLAFYRLFPSRVSGMILAATRANADTLDAQKNRDNAITLAKQFGPAAVAASMAPSLFSPERYKSNPSLVQETTDLMSKTSLEGIVEALEGMKNRQDSTAMLPSIQVPVLLIHGTEDQLIPLSVAQEMKNTIPGSTLVTIPESGHLLNLEKPEVFNRTAKNFILHTSSR